MALTLLIPLLIPDPFDPADPFDPDKLSTNGYINSPDTNVRRQESILIQWFMDSCLRRNDGVFVFGLKSMTPTLLIMF